MNATDVEYCLRRAEAERVRIEQATTPEAARVHQELHERYLQRAGRRRDVLHVVMRPG